MNQITLSTGNFDLGHCEKLVTSWEEFSNRLTKPHLINESRYHISELAKLAKTKNDPRAPEADKELRRLKGAGGFFVGGEFKTPNPGTNTFIRKKFNLATRTMITLDADNAPIDFMARILASHVAPYCGTFYTTFSHTPFKPKIRIVIPLSKPVSPDKYQAIARQVSAFIDPTMSWFDTVSYVEAQLMFFPVVCPNDIFLAESWGYTLLDPDMVLRSYPNGNWQDASQWFRTPKELADPKTYNVDKLNDPREKSGLIGAFCRAYDIHDAIETFLPEKYVAVGDNRYTHIGGNGHGGAVVYDGGTHLFSRHTHDPCNTGTCYNSFDLVRVHKFGDLDRLAPQGTPSSDLPSLKEMLKFASNDPAIAAMGFEDRTTAVYQNLPPQYQNLPPEMLAGLGIAPAIAPGVSKLTAGQIQDDMLEVLSGRKGRCYNSPGDLEKWQNVDLFTNRYKIVAPMAEGAVPLIIKIEPSCHVAEPEEIVLDLIDWIREASNQDKRFLAYFKDSTHLMRWVKLWAYRQADLKEIPKAVAFKSDPELTMNRLPYDPSPCTDAELPVLAPTFHSMLSRIDTNRTALVQRIGSIFDLKADRKQAVWLYGDADAGKSTFQWLLLKLAGPKPVCTLSKDLLQSRFCLQNLVGRRIALVPEAGSWFIRQDKFKALTGDRIHPVEPKGKATYSANIESLFFFFSNERPEIINSAEFLNRIIDCHITAVPKHEMLSEIEIQSRLERELPWIIGYCKAEYEKLGQGNRIPVNQETLTSIAEEFQSSEYEFVEKYIKPGVATMDNTREHVTPNQICRLYSEWLGIGRHWVKERDLNRFLKREFGAVVKKISGFGLPPKRVWQNILWKDPTELIALNPEPMSPAHNSNRHLTIIQPPPS